MLITINYDCRICPENWASFLNASAYAPIERETWDLVKDEEEIMEILFQFQLEMDELSGLKTF